MFFILFLFLSFLFFSRRCNAKLQAAQPPCQHAPWLSCTKLGFSIHAECTCQMHNVSELQSSNSGKAILIAIWCTISYLHQSNSSWLLRNALSRHAVDRVGKDIFTTRRRINTHLHSDWSKVTLITTRCTTRWWHRQQDASALSCFCCSENKVLWISQTRVKSFASSGDYQPLKFWGLVSCERHELSTGPSAAGWRLHPTALLPGKQQWAGAFGRASPCCTSGNAYCQKTAYLCTPCTPKMGLSTLYVKNTFFLQIFYLY